MNSILKKNNLIAFASLLILCSVTSCLPDTIVNSQEFKVANVAHTYLNDNMHKLIDPVSETTIKAVEEFLTIDYEIGNTACELTTTEIAQLVVVDDDKLDRIRNAGFRLYQVMPQKIGERIDSPYAITEDHELRFGRCRNSRLPLNNTSGRLGGLVGALAGKVSVEEVYNFNVRLYTNAHLKSGIGIVLTNEAELAMKEALKREVSANGKQLTCQGVKNALFNPVEHEFYIYKSCIWYFSPKDMMVLPLDHLAFLEKSLAQGNCRLPFGVLK